MSVKITDEMVERAARAHGSLEAALNPPPEPEIPVSEGILDAGCEALRPCDVDC